MPNLIRFSGVLILALAMVLAWNVARAESEEEFDARPATEAADAWLTLVDTGRFGESWDAAAPTFREALTRLKWEVAVDEARNKVGAMLRRKMRSARSVVNPPNSAPGEYVVIEFETWFQNRPRATETVTLMKVAEGRWKAAGYFIH